MSEPFIGEIRIFGFGFPPRGWAFCDGQLLSIQQNQALFSILGTYYGGDGMSNFKLPDLREKVGYSTGKNQLGTPYVLGQTGGEATHVLKTNEIPTHTHQVVVSPNTASLPSPANNFWAVGDVNYCSATSSGVMAGGQISAVGGQAHENRLPFLTLIFCIALQGTYPPRN